MKAITMNKHLLLFAIMATFAISTAPASIVVNWVNWTAPANYPQSNESGPLAYNYATGTTGSITMPNSLVVNVTLSGEIMNPADYGSSGFGISGNSYWNTRNYNGDTYISANVPSLPDNSDRIAVSGYGLAVQTLTFEAPVSNIVMNLWSLGDDQGTMGTWVFNQPFVILSQNAGQYPLTPYALQAEANNTLNGYEGSGTIQFTGTFSSLSWQVVNPEVYAVWNIGVTSASAPSAVPEPGTWAAAALLAGGAVFMRWRKRRDEALKQAA
jgi:hypothetical protein